MCGKACAWATRETHLGEIVMIPVLSITAKRLAVFLYDFFKRAILFNYYGGGVVPGVAVAGVGDAASGPRT
mgnify:CR=1 FL=1